MRAATGRDPVDVQIGSRCLLALFGLTDPTPEQIAAADLLTFGLLDLRTIARAHERE